MLAGITQSSVKNIAKTQINFGTVVDNLIELINGKLKDDIHAYVCNVTTSNDLEKVAKKANELVRFINSLLKKRNSLAKVLKDLMNIFKILDVITSVLDGILTVLEIILQILKSLPIPNMYTTAGLVLTLSDLLEKGKDILDKAKNVVSQISALIKKYYQIIKDLFNKLSLLDGMLINTLNTLNTCAEKRKVKIIEKVDLFDNISTNEIQNVKGFEQPNSDETYKGFKFAIKTDTTNKTKYIKRYAVAIDRFGVEVLKSESSFSSDTQVLINQLKLDIDSNSLKNN